MTTTNAPKPLYEVRETRQLTGKVADFLGTIPTWVLWFFVIIWTIPPGPAELYDALGKVSPECIVLFAVNPEMDDPPAFLRRLAGLVKYALRGRDGQVSLSSLAARTAHSRSTVRLGLAWMAQKGQIEVVSQSRDQVTLRAGRGKTRDRLYAVQAQLAAQLEEAAAYRSYYCRTDAARLVSS